MGSVASVNIEDELKHPMDGSDLADMEAAVAEVARLRGLLFAHANKEGFAEAKEQPEGITITTCPGADQGRRTAGDTRLLKPYDNGSCEWYCDRNSDACDRLTNQTGGNDGKPQMTRESFGVYNGTRWSDQSDPLAPFDLCDGCCAHYKLKVQEPAREAKEDVKQERFYINSNQIVIADANDLEARVAAAADASGPEQAAAFASEASVVRLAVGMAVKVGRRQRLARRWSCRCWVTLSGVM
jgi:hypothetical protein